ncbi:MAG: hypothetical protein OXJ36_03500 [bacterium]|nr:hypothetical protein [bacterium]MDE0437450.1 hypothetical protein [bacterium]
MKVARWTPESPLDLSRSIARHARYGPNLLNVVSGEYLYRTTIAGIPYRIRQLASGDIEVGAPRSLDRAVAESRYRLGAMLPVEPLLDVSERVPAVADQLCRAPGYRPPLNPSVAEVLVTSICSQQVNMRWAATTLNRLVERYGEPLELDGIRLWRFPSAERLAAAREADIRAMQLTTRKSSYIVGLGRHLVAGDLDGLQHESNERALQRIMAIRGLGRWTADWFLARCLGRPDAIAAGDLGVRKVVSRYVAGVDEVLAEPDVRAATDSWGDGGNWAIHLLLERWADGRIQNRRKSRGANRGP